jgi:hypothetical protein
VPALEAVQDAVGVRVGIAGLQVLADVQQRGEAPVAPERMERGEVRIDGGDASEAAFDVAALAERE